jgi:hypothetical protein
MAISTSWTNRTGPSTTFTNRTKPSTTFTDRTAPTGSSFLLKEDTDYILLESGYKIILIDRSFIGRTAVSTTFTDRTSPSTSWTDR